MPGPEQTARKNPTPQTTVEQPKLPAFSPKTEDKEVNVLRSADGKITLKIPNTAELGFSFQAMDPSGPSKGQYPIAPKNSTALLDPSRVSYNRSEDGTVEITLNKSITSLIANIKKENGEVLKIDAFKSIPLAEPKPQEKAPPIVEKKVEAKPEVKAEPKLEAKAEPKPETKLEPKPELKPETKPEVTQSIIENLGKKLEDAASGIGPVNKATLIQDINSPRYNHIPNDIKKIAEKEGYDLSLIKRDPNGVYQYCEEKSCLDIGRSKEEKIEAPSLKPSANQELDLAKIPANSIISYVRQMANGQKASGTIDLTKYGSSSTLGGIGTFTKNTDGTVKLQAEPNFSGTFKIGAAEVTTKASTDRIEMKKAIEKASMTTAEAKAYLASHPGEDVFVIVTSPGAPRYCQPCQAYEPVIPGIIAGLEGKAKVIIVDEANNSNVTNEFKVQKIPSTLYYAKDRQDPQKFNSKLIGQQKLEGLEQILKP